MKKKWIFLFCFAFCFILIFSFCQKKEEKPIEEPQPRSIISETEISKEPKEEIPVSPFDFTSLKKQNPDVIGWLQIPGTAFDLPVVQSPDDDTKYLTTDFSGNKDRNGTLYTEHAYNAADFSDPVTILYGHRIDKGKMFWGLEESFSDDFESLDKLLIYHENEILEYEVFAAVPFDNRHILYYTDFTSESEYTGFFEEVRNSTGFGSHVNTDKFPQYGDRVLILSTCLKGNIQKRYLVLGKLSKVSIFD